MSVSGATELMGVTFAISMMVSFPIQSFLDSILVFLLLLRVISVRLVGAVPNTRSHRPMPVSEYRPAQFVFQLHG